VHRLDKETSGILLIARSKEVAAKLGVQFVNKTPKKIYHAILRGELEQDEIMVDQPIKKCRPDQSKIRIRQTVDRDGKPSKTLFRPLKAANGLTLAEVQTFSGRTHQIRCHAEHIGYPILGDKLYGQTDECFLEFLNDNREPIFGSFGRLDHQLLHASSLSFTHPDSGEEMTFNVDYREEFVQFEMIQKWLNSNKNP
jgi:23S rRNA pseudouridine1911/1915/1917 synthase